MRRTPLNTTPRRQPDRKLLIKSASVSLGISASTFGRRWLCRLNVSGTWKSRVHAVFISKSRPVRISLDHSASLWLKYGADWDEWSTWNQQSSQTDVTWFSFDCNRQTDRQTNAQQPCSNCDAQCLRKKTRLPFYFWITSSKINRFKWFLVHMHYPAVIWRSLSVCEFVHTTNEKSYIPSFLHCRLQHFSLSYFSYYFKTNAWILYWRLDFIVHCVSKKEDTKLLPITSPNINRFSKFFHWQTHW